MLNQKGFSPVIVIVFVLILAAGVGGYFFLSKQTSKPQSNSVEDSAKDSQDNKNTDFSFEISQKELLFTGGFADPSVIKFKDTYYLYVNTFGGAGSANVIYSSKDGKTWQNTKKTVPGGPTKRAYVDGNAVRLYYPTRDPINPSDPPSQILSAISTDGLTFTSETGVRMVPETGYTIEGPSIVKLADGTYRMYFSEYLKESGQERKGARIVGASSKDGLTFERDEKTTIESDTTVEKSPADWPQALRPFVLKRPTGGYVMFYNSHSKLFAAFSEDGNSWKKLGGIGVKGADVDGYYMPDGTIRVYYGDFSEQTSGIVYTGILTEVKERTSSAEVPDAPGGNMMPLGSKPPAPMECTGKKATDPNLPEPCQLWFKMQ